MSKAKKEFDNIKPVFAWGVLWRSQNRLDGVRKHIISAISANPALFRTRKEAERYIKDNYGYIAYSPDLRAEPHGWRMPIPVKLKTIVIGR